MGDFQTLQNTAKNMRKHRHSKFLRNTMQSMDYSGIYETKDSVFQQEGDLFLNETSSNTNVEKVGRKNPKAH